MARIDDLTASVEKVLSIKFDARDGNIIPDTENLGLEDQAVKIDATFLYADLAGSSLIAKLCPWEVTAKIIKAYLNCCTKIIRSHSGEIRSFDGDRVMGIFKSDSKNSTATKCAREIDWMVDEVINPMAKEKFKSVKDNNIQIKHCIGIDTGEARAVKAGIRNNNDLIWIGRAPSFAAKLSDIREHPYSVFITDAVYRKLNEEAKLSDKKDIWEIKAVKFAGEDQSVYRTRMMLKP